MMNRCEEIRTQAVGWAAKSTSQSRLPNKVVLHSVYILHRLESKLLLVYIDHKLDKPTCQSDVQCIDTVGNR
jgi:hypothetical protein